MKFIHVRSLASHRRKEHREKLATVKKKKKNVRSAEEWVGATGGGAAGDRSTDDRFADEWVGASSSLSLGEMEESDEDDSDDDDDDPEVDCDSDPEDDYDLDGGYRAAPSTSSSKARQGDGIRRVAKDKRANYITVPSARGPMEKWATSRGRGRPPQRGGRVRVEERERPESPPPSKKRQQQPQQSQQSRGGGFMTHSARQRVTKQRLQRQRAERIAREKRAGVRNRTPTPPTVTIDENVSADEGAGPFSSLLLGSTGFLQEVAAWSRIPRLPNLPRVFYRPPYRMIANRPERKTIYRPVSSGD